MEVLFGQARYLLRAMLQDTNPKVCRGITRVGVIEIQRNAVVLHGALPRRAERFGGRKGSKDPSTVGPKSVKKELVVGEVLGAIDLDVGGPALPSSTGQPQRNTFARTGYWFPDLNAPVQIMQMLDGLRKKVREQFH